MTISSVFKVKINELVVFEIVLKVKIQSSDIFFFMLMFPLEHKMCSQALTDH